MSDLSKRLELPLDPSGVIRLRATARASLELGLTIIGEPWKDGRVELAVTGPARGLPATTDAVVTCLGGPVEREVEGRLVIADGKARLVRRDAGPDAQSFSVTVEEAGAFGEAPGRLRLHVRPKLADAPLVAVTGDVPFEHVVSVRPSCETDEELRVGDVVTFRPTVHERLRHLPLRVHITEHDDGASEQPSERDLDVMLDVPLAPEDAYGPPLPAQDLTPRPFARWHVGCDGKGLPDYAEEKEEGGYEFRYRTVIGEGEHAITLHDWRPLCRAPRPKLTKLQLELDTIERQDLTLSPRTFMALRRARAGGPKIGHSYLYLRGELTGLSPSLSLGAKVTLWQHRVVGPTAHHATRLALPARFPRIEGGKLEALLFDGADLDESVVAELAPPPGASDPLDGLFAVVELVGWTDRKLPLDAVIDFARDTFRPFGRHGPVDLRGPLTADAVAVCTRGVAELPLRASPRLGVPAARVEGEDLVVEAPLHGADASYWKEAAPRLEWRVAGGQWAPFGARAEPVDGRVRGTMPIAGWPGKGNQVLFRAVATNTQARLGEMALASEPGGETPFDCRPEVLDVRTKLASDGTTLEVYAATRFFPTGPRTVRTLSVRLLDAGVDLKQRVKYALECDEDGRCDLDGTFRATITLKADVLAKLKAGELQVHVFRRHTDGKVFDLKVTSTPVPATP